MQKATASAAVLTAIASGLSRCKSSMNRDVWKLRNRFVRDPQNVIATRQSCCAPYKIFTDHPDHYQVDTLDQQETSENELEPGT